MISVSLLFSQSQSSLFFYSKNCIISEYINDILNIFLETIFKEKSL